MDIQFIKLFSKHSNDPLQKFLLNKDKGLKQKVKATKEDDSKAYLFYSTFKQVSPLLPIIPSLYDLATSRNQDEKDNTLILFNICESIEDVAIAFYSLTSCIFYQFFKASKNSHHVLKKRRNWSKIIRVANKCFILFCILISLAKVVLGYITANLNADSEKISPEEFIFDLISDLGLVLAELFYLHSIFLKKFYKLNGDEHEKIEEKIAAEAKNEDKNKADDQEAKLDLSNNATEETRCDFLVDEENEKVEPSFLEKEGSKQLSDLDSGDLKQVIHYAQDNKNYIVEFTNLLKTHNDSKEELERLKRENMELKESLGGPDDKALSIEISE